MCVFFKVICQKVRKDIADKIRIYEEKRAAEGAPKKQFKSSDGES